MKLTRKKIEAPDWKLKDIERSRTHLETETNDDGGILRWKSNNAVVPPWVFEEAFVEAPEGQQKAREKEVEESVAEYRRLNTGRKRTPEELYEMRAAFGPGETVVDVITGDSIVL